MARRKTYKSKALRVEVPEGLNTNTAEWFARHSPGLVRSAAGRLLASIRAGAPQRTGALRRGLVLRPGVEKNKLGVTVADVWPDPAMNDTFAKITKAGKRAYYPSSMEYGFNTRYVHGKYGQTRRVAGRYYMKVEATAEYHSWQEQVAEAVDNYLAEEASKE